MWFKKPKWQRFLKYSLVGAGTFLFDLALLYSSVSIFGFSYVIATPIAFIIAVSVNFFISRRVVFHGSTRRMRAGYVRFIIAALIGAFVTTFFVAALVREIGVSYLIARIFAAVCIGIANYLYNLYHNFKVAHHHGATHVVRERDTFANGSTSETVH